jgi:hypothetical protein
MKSYWAIVQPTEPYILSLGKHKTTAEATKRAKQFAAKHGYELLYVLTEQDPMLLLPFEPIKS